MGALLLVCIFFGWLYGFRGGEPRILRLRGQDATEDVLRRTFVEDLADDRSPCEAVLSAPSVRVALERMGAWRAPEERLQPGELYYVQPRIMDGAVAKPGQTGRYRDKLRMAEILIEVCR